MSAPIPEQEPETRIVKRLSHNAGQVRYRIEGHDEILAFSTAHDGAKVWELLRRIEKLELAELSTLRAGLAAARVEKDAALTRAVIAERHKVLSLLGKSSWPEAVEDKLRTELAESQIALAAMTTIRDEANGALMGLLQRLFGIDLVGDDADDASIIAREMLVQQRVALTAAEAARDEANNQRDIAIGRMQKAESISIHPEELHAVNARAEAAEAQCRAARAQVEQAKIEIESLVGRLVAAQPLSIGSIDTHRDARYPTSDVHRLSLLAQSLGET